MKPLNERLQEIIDNNSKIGQPHPISYDCDAVLSIAEQAYNLDRQWVPVNDRLPKPISTVLIWTNISIEPTLAFYINNDWLYFSNHENFWLKNQPHIEVIAWMPLPQPPLTK